MNSSNGVIYVFISCICVCFVIRAEIYVFIRCIYVSLVIRAELPCGARSSRECQDHCHCEKLGIKASQQIFPGCRYRRYFVEQFRSSFALLFLSNLFALFLNFNMSHGDVPSEQVTTDLYSPTLSMYKSYYTGLLILKKLLNCSILKTHLI